MLKNKKYFTLSPVSLKHIIRRITHILLCTRTPVGMGGFVLCSIAKKNQTFNLVHGRLY